MPRGAQGSRSLAGALVLSIVAVSGAAFAQQPPAQTVPGQPAPQPKAPVQPTEPGAPTSVTPEPAPVPTLPVPIPVIPDVQSIGPPPTVPSAPQRALPPTSDLTGLATLQFEPALTLREEFTDNFDLAERKKRSNFRTVVSPELRLHINSPLTKGLIEYTFSPSYDTSTDEVLLFHSLLGQVVWQANPRWKLTLADTFTKGDERSDADSLGLRQERRTFTTNAFAVTSDYLIGSVATRQAYRLNTFFDDNGRDTITHTVAANATVPIYRLNLLGLGYDYLTSHTSGGSATTSTQIVTTGEDFRVQGHQVTASVSRQLSSLTLLGLKTGYAWRDVTNDGDDTDYQIWNASVFANYMLPARLLLNASIGVTGLTSSAQTVDPTLFVSSSLTYQFARATATLAVDRGLSETFADGENFGVVETEGVTATLSYPFTPSLRGTASAFLRHNKFTRAGNVTVIGPDDETTNWGGSATLSWRVLRSLRLDVSYTYFDQTGSNGGNSSTADNLNYTENRVQASIRLTF